MVNRAIKKTKNLKRRRKRKVKKTYDSSFSFKYYIVYKPFGVLSQFTGSENQKSLQLLYSFPKDVYPVGRLDKDSEGLLLLTNDKALNQALLHPTYNKSKEYWVQVEGVPDQAAIDQLCSGVSIKLKKGYYQTLPAQVSVWENPPSVPERNPPIRFRKNILTTWLRIILREGKNRQIRKMTAQVAYPTLRLIRVKLAQLNTFDLDIGEVKELSRTFVYKKLGL